MQLGFAAGTIPVEKLAAFERLLFRATRGNMFLKHTPVRRAGAAGGGCRGGISAHLWGAACRGGGRKWGGKPGAQRWRGLITLRASHRVDAPAARPPRVPISPQVGSVADPASGERVEKSVFVVFFAGERARQKVRVACVPSRLVLASAVPACLPLVHHRRSVGGGLPQPDDLVPQPACRRAVHPVSVLACPQVLKICEAFSANRYPFPEDLTRQRQMNAEVGCLACSVQSSVQLAELSHRMPLEAELQSGAAAGHPPSGAAANTLLHIVSSSTLPCCTS